MNVRIIIAITSWFILFSCESKKEKTGGTRRILAEDVYAEGQISPDSIYNGLIKFYDTATNKLVIEAIYKNGKLDGKRIDYYPNGKINNIAFYQNGQQHGTVEHFDSAGQLLIRQDFYHGLRVGNTVVYRNSKPVTYHFASLEERVLFYIDYDSIDVEMSEINDNTFFFWRKTGERLGTSGPMEDFFIYIIDPPGFTFEYSLCVVNEKGDILQTVKTFDTSKIWDTFELNNKSLEPGRRYALRLTFDRTRDDPFGDKGEMHKYL